MKPLNIIAVFQGGKLFVHTIYKVSLFPTMELVRLACRENYVYVFDTQAGILEVEEIPVFVIVLSLQ